MYCALTVMLGFLDSKSLISAFSLSAFGPVCVCQKLIVTGLLIVTLSTELPVPAAAESALSAATTPAGTAMLPPVADGEPDAPGVAAPLLAALVAVAALGEPTAVVAAVVAACVAACVAALVAALLFLLLLLELHAIASAIVALSASGSSSFFPVICIALLLFPPSAVRGAASPFSVALDTGRRESLDELL